MVFKKNQVPWNKTNTETRCNHCEKLFHIAPSRLTDTKVRRGVFCSRACSDASKSGKPTWNKGLSGDAYKKHYPRGFGGVFFKRDSIFAGDRKEYMALHHWVRKTLGKSNVCESCGTKQGGKRIQWANKSGEYRKDAGDWIRLCAKCHYKYDTVRKTEKLPRT